MDNHYHRALTLETIVASRSSRLIAFIIDSIIYELITFGVIFLTFKDNIPKVKVFGTSQSQRSILEWVLCIFLPILVNGWFMRKGQTIGKKIRNIYVADINTNEPIGFVRCYFVRYVIAYSILILCYSPLYIFVEFFPTTFSKMMQIIPINEPLNLILFFLIITLIMLIPFLMIFRVDRRCFHDLLAKTHVLEIGKKL